MGRRDIAVLGCTGSREPDPAPWVPPPVDDDEKNRVMREDDD